MRKRLILCLLVLLHAGPGWAYGILTHEALVDASWDAILRPAIQKRYPGTNDSTLTACRAFAYGGAVVPDMGYFPRCNPLFSDLLHYVRTGSFVTTLLADAATPQEYAFALGVLAHYNADRYGHPLGVNPSVPLVFPKKKPDTGTVLTYEQDPTAHVRTEFGFDVLQVARGAYASEAYQHFIRFGIADSLLKRTFFKTYGLRLDDLFKNYDRSMRTFRWSVRNVVPQLTRYAWRSRRHQIQEQTPTATARSFHYRMRRSAFRAEYGHDIDRPGLPARIVAGLLIALPKIGPLKPLKPVIPNAQAEQLFVRSFDTVRVHLRQTAAVAPGVLLDVDWDTGKPTAPGEYAKADATHDALLLRLQEDGWKTVSEPLKAKLLAYYARRQRPEPAAPADAKVAAALDSLRTSPGGL